MLYYQWSRPMALHKETLATSWGGAALVVEPADRPRDRMRFIRFPWQVYAGNQYWAPPLLYERRRYFDPAINPFFRHAEVQLFIARRGGRDIGTIAAFAN